jgi:peptidyl-prolyl cis-trans isomerase A (cyclophilin A)
MRSLRARVCVEIAFLAMAVLLSGARAAEPAGGNSATPSTAADQAAKAAPEVALVRVVLHTELGDIVLGLDSQHAPITSANFLRYVDEKRFDGITFYRALKIDPEGHYGLVQGGLRGNLQRVFDPIAHEAPSATGLKNVDGAVAMARLDPGTADADFFIDIGDLPSLDGQPGSDDPGYAVFGRVLEGMDVVHKILDLPRDPDAGEGDMKGQMLANPVQIVTVRRAG